MSRRTPIIVGAVFAGLAVLLVAVLVVPKLSQVGSTQQELQAALEREQALRTQLDQLREAREQAQAVQKELRRLQNEIPPTADIPGLVRLLNNIWNASGVEFMSVTPGAPIVPPDVTFSVIPTQVTVTGGFFAVDDFLFRLETLPRAVKVTQLTVTAGPTGLPSLQISMTAEVYTTDVSAGPGSVPGPTESQPTPEASPAAGG